jgi:hypothetical protein
LSTPHNRWVPHWRNGEAYARLAQTDRAGLMWEWLRRDTGYVDWHVQASRTTGGTPGEPLKWGLHFR